MPAHSLLSHLACARCGALHDADVPQGLCACGGPLLARYDLPLADAVPSGGGADLWRYHQLLPVRDPRFALSLGEGQTPLIPSRVIGPRLGVDLWLKDESGNPTGSFQARGLSVAVARAAELGARSIVLPTAGNAGGAAACYAARHGLAARVYLPAEASETFALEAAAFGAEVVSVPGSIADAARRLASERRDGDHDLSTLKEPYRLEGKKTMGYELLEQLGRLPDVIVYPTGGGTGLVGMWKAFDELEALGRTGARRPRMVAVQSTGCAPVVAAFASGAVTTTGWPEPRTVAEGLRVPAPLADREILQVLRASGGTAVAVPDEEILRATLALARNEGVLTSPEGGAAFAALERLAASGEIAPGATVVLFLTGSATKAPDAIRRALRSPGPAAKDALPS